MARSLRVTIIDKDTRINFSLPIGLVSRLLRFGGDIANVFAKGQIKMQKIVIQDYKIAADFIEALREFEPFILVDIEDKDAKVFIRTED